ncbi:MAG: adenylate/guanylate cyclase domain-containing protein [Candidatus Riflebacteria bacterium]|nr:adenylate/guanylate cyclase domain-containing protein [Candidatus Riflebacteria bacterium]
MTKAQEFMAQLNPLRIINSRIDKENIEKIHNSYSQKSNPERFESLEIVRALPDFNKNVKRELIRFNKYFQKRFEFKPEFLMAINADSEKCDLILSQRLATNNKKLALLRQELASMSPLLNQRSFYQEDEPREIRHFDTFPIFNETLGLSHNYNTRFWRFEGRFSGIINQNIYLITMRYPGKNGQCNFLLTGIAIDNISPVSILRDISRSLSNDQITIKAGYSPSQLYPFFIEELGQVSLLTNMPAAFTHLFSRTMSGTDKKALVIRLHTNIENLRSNTEKYVSQISLFLLIVAFATFLLAAGISFGRINIRVKMTKVIAFSFITCLLFPLTAMLWLGIMQTQTSNDAAIQQSMQTVSRKLKEYEQSFLLVSYRRQLLFKSLMQLFEKSPVNDWSKIARHFFSRQHSALFGRHFFNFYLYDSHDHEYFRGQGPDENPMRGEICRLFVGPARKIMTLIGAFDGLSETERTRIAQIGDFASGLMDQMMRPQLISQMLKTPGELFLSDFMARRDLFCSYLIRQSNKIAGLLFFLTDNRILMSVISDLLGANCIPTRFIVDRYQVDLAFYPISDFDRSLNGRVMPRSADKPQVADQYQDTANAVYSNSDFNQINNLHQTTPHLLITDSIFNNSVFAFAYATPIAGSGQQTVALIVLLIFIAVLSCFFLAGGVARLLLLQLPPFLTAMHEIENDRYDWQLAIHGGNEFDELADSINTMRISLFERKKMMQLVSANAIEAAQSDFHGQLTSQRREAAILFCDIRGFTTISETRSAEEVVEMLNAYFSQMCPIIEQHGGFIDKLIGDAIQAVFYGGGEISVNAAGQAALQMREALTVFNRERALNGHFTIDNGIGIAFGLVITGLVGSQSGKLDAAILGNVLNSAQQLETQSKFAKNTKILLDFEAYSKIRSIAEAELIPECVAQAANSENTGIYELLKINETTD